MHILDSELGDIMARGVWRLTVRSDFSAAHALRHYEGKCERLHGHNFATEMTVEGDTLEPEKEFLLDFKVLKQALKDVLEELDHRLLNECPPFDRLNPTSENLARHILQRASEKLNSYPIRVRSVTVSEKGAQSATYEEIA